jgi:hypothetical protein
LAGGDFWLWVKKEGFARECALVAELEALLKG